MEIKPAITRLDHSESEMFYSASQLLDAHTDLARLALLVVISVILFVLVSIAINIFLAYCVFRAIMQFTNGGFGF